MRLPTITTNELTRLIHVKGDYVLIDVRNPDELQHGMIPTAKNIPISEFEEALSMTPKAFEKRYGFPKMKKEDSLILYCRTGSRSTIATTIAISKGYNARNYAGSIWEWSQTDSNVKWYGPPPK